LPQDRAQGVAVGEVRGQRPTGATAEEKGFVSLFNGKNKSGWKTYPTQPGDWSIVKGTNGDVLTGSGTMRLMQGRHLFSERGDYKDFHLRVEARINNGGNSGVYVRTQFGPGFPKGYEAQINSTHRDAIKTGSLYPAFDAKLTKEQRNKLIVKEMLVKPDEWFTLELIAQGNHIVIKVNDKTTVDFVDESNAYTKGHIALQKHDAGTVCEFRRIEIKELDSGKVITTASGLKYEDLKEGTGTAAGKGDTVEVHYTGWLTSGKKFDSSLNRGAVQLPA
jgi:hypothetical protein